MKTAVSLFTAVVVAFALLLPGSASSAEGFQAAKVCQQVAVTVLPGTPIQVAGFFSKVPPVAKPLLGTAWNTLATAADTYAEAAQSYYSRINDGNDPQASLQMKEMNSASAVVGKECQLVPSSPAASHDRLAKLLPKGGYETILSEN